MRALDGTYWTWRWAPGSFARLEVATKQEVLDSYGGRFASQRYWTKKVQS